MTVPSITVEQFDSTKYNSTKQAAEEAGRCTVAGRVVVSVVFDLPPALLSPLLVMTHTQRNSVRDVERVHQLNNCLNPFTPETAELPSELCTLAVHPSCAS